MSQLSTHCWPETVHWCLQMFQCKLDKKWHSDFNQIASALQINSLKEQLLNLYMSTGVLCLVCSTLGCFIRIQIK